MGRTQRRRHRSNLNSERIGNRAVIEVCVVAQVNDQPLPLRQGDHPRANARFARLPVHVRNPRSLGSLAPRQPATTRRERSVHNGAPHPCLQRPLAAKRLLLPKRLCEPVLDGIVPARLVTNDGRRYAQEVPVTPPIEVFKLAGERRSLCHHRNDAREAPVCLVALALEGHSGTLAQASVYPLWDTWPPITPASNSQNTNSRTRVSTTHCHVLRWMFVILLCAGSSDT